MIASPSNTVQPLRILLVEDNRVNQKIATRLLLQLGYSTDIAENGREALVALEQNTYDIILMDIMMPIMDGLEATRQITAIYAPHQRPKIIAVTANALPEDRKACIEAGMDAFLPKPYTLEQLRDLLHLERRPPSFKPGYGTRTL